MQTDNFENPAGAQCSNLEFDQMIQKLLEQNGYNSENSRKGLEFALKDYNSIFCSEAPSWLSTVWTSTAMSLVHLAIARKQKLPEQVRIPQSALMDAASKVRKVTQKIILK